MNKELRIHEVTNGAGESLAWAVIRNGCEKVAEFETLAEACAFADGTGRTPAEHTSFVAP